MPRQRSYAGERWKEGREKEIGGQHPFTLTTADDLAVGAGSSREIQRGKEAGLASTRRKREEARCTASRYTNLYVLPCIPSTQTEAVH